MAKRPTNPKLLEEYLQDAELQGIQGESRSAYKGKILDFQTFLGRKSCLDVRVSDLKGYLAVLRGHKRSPATLRFAFSAISSFYDFLVFEEHITGNPVPGFRKRYLTTVRREASKDQSARRQLLSVEDMRRLIHSITDVRDRAFLVLTVKLGARREEVVSIDVEDIDWVQQSILLKPHPKRTNCLVFFDEETARTLRRWIAIRKARGAPTGGALFVGDQGGRLSAAQAGDNITAAARVQGFHDPRGALNKRFTPHCCRHFFTTHLRRAKMEREHVAWLRGDAPKGTMDIYLHIDPQEVRTSYRARIPQFGL